MTQGVAFDLQAVCSGFVFGVTTADKFLASGSHKRALVIGAETFSRLLDWTDRTTCVLFGDGAGAMVLEAVEVEGDARRRRHNDAVALGWAPPRQALRRRRALDHADGRASAHGGQGGLQARGGHGDRRDQGVFREAGVRAEDIDWFVPHQANRRIIDASADKLGIAREKVVVTVDIHGNTSAASIPLALDVAVSDGRIKPGDLVMIEAMGGGFTWGAALIRW